MFVSKQQLEFLRARYPVGTRLELKHMDGEGDMQSGLRGTVFLVDDAGQIQMNWDNGRSLALNSETDLYRKLSQEEIEAENQAIEQSSSPSMSMRGVNMDNEKLLAEFTNYFDREIPPQIDWQRLGESYQTDEKDYAKSLLKEMHDKFCEVYGTDTIEDEYFIVAPAVIKVRETGNVIIGLVRLDIASSGEHWGTDFVTPHGVFNVEDEELSKKQLEYVRSFIPYDYFYTINIPNDIHVNMDSMPDDVRMILSYCNEQYASQAKNETEIKIVKYFSSLEIKMDTQDGSEEYEVLDNQYALQYFDKIKDAVDLYNYRTIGATGLMEYFDESSSVAEKVVSAFPAIEIIDGKVYGVMITKQKEALTTEEEKIFLDAMIGQYSDGWGEGFEQREIDTRDGDIFVCFWQCGNDFFIYNQEDFEANILNNDMQMGGLK